MSVDLKLNKPRLKPHDNVTDLKKNKKGKVVCGLASHSQLTMYVWLCELGYCVFPICMKYFQNLK